MPDRGTSKEGQKLWWKSESLGVLGRGKAAYMGKRRAAQWFGRKDVINEQLPRLVDYFGKALLLRGRRAT